MTIVDEQSDLIFSDNNISKPKNNNYNSDNLLANLDSEKHDMNFYITYEKKSELC